MEMKMNKNGRRDSEKLVRHTSGGTSAAAASKSQMTPLQDENM